MFGIRAVAVIFGIVLVLTAATETETDLHTKFSQLETQVKVLTHRLQQEEKFTQQCQQKEEKLTERLHQEEEKMSGLQIQMDLLKKNLENITDLLSDSKTGHSEDISGKFQGHGIRENLEPNRRHSRSSDPYEVGFTADLSHELNNVPGHSILKFDNLVHWTGNSYDTSTGVFTCPTAGLYLFAVFIETNSVNAEALVYLKKEGTIFTSIISERSDPGEDDTGGNVVLLTVNKGERVWVETGSVDDQSFWPNFTTFSGVLIQRH